LGDDTAGNGGLLAKVEGRTSAAVFKRSVKSWRCVRPGSTRDYGRPAFCVKAVRNALPEALLVADRLAATTRSAQFQPCRIWSASGSSRLALRAYGVQRWRSPGRGEIPVVSLNLDGATIATSVVSW